MHTTQDNLDGDAPLKLDRVVGLTAPSLKRPADASNAPNAKKVKATAQLLSSSM